MNWGRGKGQKGLPPTHPNSGTQDSTHAEAIPGPSRDPPPPGLRSLEPPQDARNPTLSPWPRSESVRDQTPPLIGTRKSDSDTPFGDPGRSRPHLQGPKNPSQHRWTLESSPPPKNPGIRLHFSPMSLQPRSPRPAPPQQGECALATRPLQSPARTVQPRSPIPAPDALSLGTQGFNPTSISPGT